MDRDIFHIFPLRDVILYDLKKMYSKKYYLIIAIINIIIQSCFFNASRGISVNNFPGLFKGTRGFAKKVKVKYETRLYIQLRVLSI